MRIINKGTGETKNKNNSPKAIKWKTALQRNTRTIAFNNYFINVCKNLTKDISDHTTNNTNFYHTIGPLRNSLYLYPISDDEVMSVINKLKNANTEDIYSISNKIIKLSANFIIKPLTNMINKAVAGVVYPETLKLARVLPLYKKGDTTEPKIQIC